MAQRVSPHSVYDGSRYPNLQNLSPVNYIRLEIWFNAASWSTVVPNRLEMLHRVVAALHLIGEKDSYIAGIWFRLGCPGDNKHGILKEIHVHIAVYSQCRPLSGVLENRPRNPMGPCSQAGLHRSQPPIGGRRKSHCSTGRRRCRSLYIGLDHIPGGCPGVSMKDSPMALISWVLRPGNDSKSMAAGSSQSACPVSGNRKILPAAWPGRCRRQSHSDSIRCSGLHPRLSHRLVWK